MTEWTAPMDLMRLTVVSLLPGRFLGHVPFLGSAAGSALWPTVHITYGHPGPVFTGAGLRKVGGGTHDMAEQTGPHQTVGNLKCQELDLCPLCSGI